MNVSLSGARVYDVRADRGRTQLGTGASDQPRMTSSEQDPLLPSSNAPERAEQADRPSQRGRLSTWRIRVAEALESAYVHKLVITLVRLSTIIHVLSFDTLPFVDRHRRRMRAGRSRVYPFNL